MRERLRALRIFISSPSDVSQERNAAAKIISAANKVCRQANLLLEIVRWEDMPPRTNPYGAPIQEVINKTIRSCDVFILILDKRFGKIEKGFEISNTEREVEEAFKLAKLKYDIKILAYFKEIPENEDAGLQEQGVKELRNRLSNDKGVWYFLYKDIHHFQEYFTHHIYDTALKFGTYSKKAIALANFWQFGIPDRYVEKNVAILYPTMDFTYLTPTNPDTYWKNRILPQVLYEDTQALGKVEKTLRIIHAHNFGFYPVSSCPSEIKFMNRIWVCQARNRVARYYHDQHKHKMNFYFTRANGEKEAILAWRTKTTSRFFEINSPLTAYLHMQRKDSPRKWTEQMEDVVAKDYAILARMRCEHFELPVKEGYMYDYFISGIRGLGTWGAAYFIDRYYHTLEAYAPEEDIQLLLEVTYKNKRIFNIKNVSNETQAYFRKQNTLEHISSVIEERGEENF